MYICTDLVERMRRNFIVHYSLSRNFKDQNLKINFRLLQPTVTPLIKVLKIYTRPEFARLRGPKVLCTFLYRCATECTEIGEA